MRWTPQEVGKVGEIHEPPTFGRFRFLRCDRRPCFQEDLPVAPDHGKARQSERAGHRRSALRARPGRAPGANAGEPREAWRTRSRGIRETEWAPALRPGRECGPCDFRETSQRTPRRPAARILPGHSADDVRTRRGEPRKIRLRSGRACHRGETVWPRWGLGARPKPDLAWDL